MFHSVGILIICRRRKNKADHYSSRIVFDVKEVFMLYSENIQYHIKLRLVRQVSSQTEQKPLWASFSVTPVTPIKAENFTGMVRWRKIYFSSVKLAKRKDYLKERPLSQPIKKLVKKNYLFVNATFINLILAQVRDIAKRAIIVHGVGC